MMIIIFAVKIGVIADKLINQYNNVNFSFMKIN